MFSVHRVVCAYLHACSGQSGCSVMAAVSSLWCVQVLKCKEVKRQEGCKSISHSSCLSTEKGVRGQWPCCECVQACVCVCTQSGLLGLLVAAHSLQS